MKKHIGKLLALYPTPLVVVGAMVNGKPNWLLAGHVGIMGHDHVMVSLAKNHYTCLLYTSVLSWIFILIPP